MLLALLLPSLAGCAAKPINPPDEPARFIVHVNDVIARDFVGFGGQINPYLYCRPNWTGSPTTRPAQGLVGEQNVAELERKLIELGPQHVRIFFQPEWWERRYDDYVAHGDPTMLESFLRTVRLAQRAGATVNLTLWHGPWPRPQEQARRFARLLDDIVNHQGLTCVRYVTIQNEPNNPEHARDGAKVRRIPFDTYDALYLSFDAELRRVGLRDRIQIVSGDLVGDDQHEWFDHLATHLAGVSDGYSMHAYWDYTDTPKLVRRLTDVRGIVDAMPPEQRRPIYCTEFGVRGRRDVPKIEPGDFVNADGTRTPIADTTAQAVQIAWFDLLAVNLGYRAVLQWELYDAWYDRLMPYGTIGDVTTGWKLKPAYQMLRLLTHTTRPGWQTLRVDGGDDATIVSALRGPDGALTVFALNDGESRRSIRIAVSSPARLRRILWTDGSLREMPMPASPGEVETVDLPAHSLVALTTRDWNPNP